MFNKTETHMIVILSAAKDLGLLNGRRSFRAKYALQDDSEFTHI